MRKLLNTCLLLITAPLTAYAEPHIGDSCSLENQVVYAKNDDAFMCVARHLKFIAPAPSVGQPCWTVTDIHEKPNKQGLICRNGTFLMAVDAKHVKEIKRRPCVDARGSNVHPDGTFYSCRVDKNGVMYIQ